MRQTWPVLLFVAAACGGDSSGPDANIDASLVGEWVAEPACAPPCAFTLISVKNPQARLEAVSALGVTVRIGVTASGAFTLSGTVSESGTARTAGSMLIVTGPSGTDTIDYRIEGGNLHLDFRSAYAITIPPATQPDSVRLEGVFRRR